MHLYQFFLKALFLFYFFEFIKIRFENMKIMILETPVVPGTED